jgi:hypothetical protein
MHKEWILIDLFSLAVAYPEDICRGIVHSCHRKVNVEIHLELD